jgi:ABC-type multidrug transport system ATPase subunit
MLQFKNITVYRGGTAICRDLFLEIGRGTTLIISGKNSSGKSSLISCITTGIKPTSGQILLDHHDLHQLSSREKKLFLESSGIVLQQDSLLPFDSVSSLLARTQANLKDVSDLLTYFGLSMTQDRLVQELSTSQKKKLELILSLLKNPKLLIWDEPFMSLDEESKEKMKSKLLQLKTSGTTIVIATNNFDTFNFLNPEKIIKL